MRTGRLYVFGMQEGHLERTTIIGAPHWIEVGRTLFLRAENYAMCSYGCIEQMRILELFCASSRDPLVEIKCSADDIHKALFHALLHPLCSM